jgi:type IV pilus assembly protein PilM
MFQRPAVGLDFRDMELISTAMQLRRGQPEIRHIHIHRFPKSWLNPERIEDVVQYAALQVQLKRAFSSGDGRRMRRGKAHLGIPTQLTVLRRISGLPIVPRDRMREILAFEVAENVPLPFDEPIYDFIQLQSSHPPEETSLLEGASEAAVAAEEGLPSGEAILFATSRKLSEQLSRAVRSASLRPISAEMKGLALLRLIHYLSPEWLRAFEMVLDMGDGAFDLHIYRDGLLVFSRNIEMDGWDDVTGEAVPRADAVHMRSDAPQDKNYDIERYAEETAREIDSAVNFYRYSMNERDIPVTRLIIVGKYDETLPQRLSALTGYAVEIPSFVRLRKRRYHPDGWLSQAAVSIGLALRGCLNGK